MFKNNGLGLRSSCLALAKNLVLFTCLSTLVACAGTSAARRDQIIAERAQERWEALLAGDYERAYAYASPGYRSGASLTDFEVSMRVRRVQYISAEYQDHHCEEAACAVRMRVGYRVARPAPGLTDWTASSVLTERWVNSGGKWWFIPE